MVDLNKEMYQRDYVEIEMHYTSEYGEKSVIHKKVPTDWLDLSERDIVDRIYLQFLNTCGFYVHPEDQIVIDRYEK